jgi:23S rRNA pseudouridine1911/1915/1917 synthase
MGGELVVIYRPPPEEPETPRTFEVAFEDEWVLAVNKPPGLPMHPTARYHHNTLTSLLKEVYGDKRPTITHRLDAETSGLVLCAKTRESERSLKIMFAERKIRKTYLALTFGVPDPPEGRVEVPMRLDKDGPIRIKMCCAPDGLASLTEYRVLEARAERALVECRPRTGRQHQIRVHLAHLGYPIVGDKLYGPDPDVFLDYISQGPTEDIIRRAGAPRQLLHAVSVSLNHPVTHEPLTIDCPLPMDMTCAAGN